LECPTRLTQKKVKTTCLHPGACLTQTRSEWHYLKKPARLRAEWIALLQQLGWKVYPMDGGWVQALKGKDEVLNAWIEPDGDGSQLVFID
jgi:hypothetical protein